MIEQKDTNGTFAAAIVAIATFIILLIGIMLYVYFLDPPPPQNITMSNITITNNQTIPISNYGVSTLSAMVGIIALIMSVMGVFLTLELIGVGNFCQNFVTTLADCERRDVDMNELVKMRKNVLGSDEVLLLDLVKVRTKKIYKYRRWLGIANIGASVVSIFIIILITCIICYYNSHIDDLWGFIWKVILLYLAFLILILSAIGFLVYKVVSYPDLAELHKALAERIIGKITKDKEKVHQENTDSKSKQKTPSENAEEKESGVTGEDAREGSNR